MRRNLKVPAGILSSMICTALSAQQKDTVRTLKPVTVTGYKTVRGVGHLLETKDNIIYAGKKTEVIIVDSLDANKAINNTRQVLGRIPGLNIVETESGGFTANGIATRGLNPVQSIEMNTRQNGYNISADIYGYNEAYYIPPMEAVHSIELVRGAAALQFGAQFGGMVNYVLNEAPKDKPFEFTTSQTLGSFALFNSFNSVGGTYKKWSYYAFLQYRNMQGWRPNSQQWQYSGFGRIQYDASEKLSVGLEYSLLQNRIQMPGGLTDSEFAANPKSSFRARNWLKSPWNVITAFLNDNLSKQTSLSIKSALLWSSRSLVWRNEDGGPEAFDTIDAATNSYAPREVEHEYMHSSTTELRILHNYSIGKMKNTLAGGIRYAYAWFKRQEGGEGSTGSDFDLSITGEFENDLDFTTTNIAPFMENIFRLGNKLTVTPGVRYEYLSSTAKGYITDSLKIPTNESSKRSYPLFGIGLEYKTGINTSLYANISQAYRPIDYSQLTPIGVASVIDPNLKDQYGFNSDLGWRGTVRNFLNFDISLFYLEYDRRIGTVLMTDASGNPYTYRTNVANSVNKGLESYVEFNFLKCLYPNSGKGLSIFDSFGYTDAKYTTGEFKNNRVEEAVKYINRVGLIYNDAHFSGTFQVNYTGDSYGDATNAKISTDPIAGYIPAYTVLDFSATYRINNYAIKGGINNLGGKAYFTRRTDEYPGPGIIPAVGRSIYIGVSAKF
jgi:Fe(3+) dicitrate transport protein